MSLLPSGSLFCGGFFPLFFTPFRPWFDEEAPGRAVFCTSLPCVGVDVVCLHVLLADIFKAIVHIEFKKRERAGAEGSNCHV